MPSYFRNTNHLYIIQLYIAYIYIILSLNNLLIFSSLNQPFSTLTIVFRLGASLLIRWIQSGLLLIIETFIVLLRFIYGLYILVKPGYLNLSILRKDVSSCCLYVCDYVYILLLK